MIGSMVSTTRDTPIQCFPSCLWHRREHYGESGLRHEVLLMLHDFRLELLPIDLGLLGLELTLPCSRGIRSSYIP